MLTIYKALDLILKRKGNVHLVCEGGQFQFGFSDDLGLPDSCLCLPAARTSIAFSLCSAGANAGFMHRGPLLHQSSLVLALDAICRGVVDGVPQSPCLCQPRVVNLQLSAAPPPCEPASALSCFLPLMEGLWDLIPSWQMAMGGVCCSSIARFVFPSFLF